MSGWRYLRTRSRDQPCTIIETELSVGWRAQLSHQGLRQVRPKIECRDRNGGGFSPAYRVCGLSQSSGRRMVVGPNDCHDMEPDRSYQKGSMMSMESIAALPLFFLCVVIHRPAVQISRLLKVA